jgi:hypothetical protein
LSAAALLNATVGQGGWSEVRRLAGRPYALATDSIAQDGQEALSLAARYNRENTIHALEMMIGGLTGIQKALKESNATDLDWRLDRAAQDHLNWWKERQKADWLGAEQDAAAAPNLPGMMDRMLGMFAPKRDKKK